MLSTPPRHRVSIDTATCVLHIGTPKTGSTAIQHFLSDNRPALAQAGFVYPASIERGHGQHDLSFLLCSAYPEWAVPQLRSLDELIDAVRIEQGRNGLRLVLSSENFYWLNEPAKVAALLSRLGHPPETTAIVVYLRPQEEAVVSWYNQLVKAQGYTGDFAASLSDYEDLWDYAARLEQWSSAFGKARIVVKRYPRGAESDVRLDIAELLGINASIDSSTARENGRLIRDVLEFQRMINQLPLPTCEKRRFHKKLITLSAHASSALFSDAPLLTEPIASDVRMRYATGNAWVAANFLDEACLFPQTDHANHPRSPAPYVPLGAEKIGAILAWLMIDAQDGKNAAVAVTNE